MKHTCIKPTCGNTYKSDDDEAYYCPSCIAENKRIAAEIDAKAMRKSSRNRKSELQEFDEQAINVRGIPCIRVQL